MTKIDGNEVDLSWVPDYWHQDIVNYLSRMFRHDPITSHHRYVVYVDRNTVDPEDGREMVTAQWFDQPVWGNEDWLHAENIRVVGMFDGSEPAEAILKALQDGAKMGDEELA